jgi:manganese transport protein
LSERSRGSAIRTLVRTWGPAWLVMIADVDAASIITAAENGALYGTGLVWLLVLLMAPLFVIQEAAGRVGIVTGKGLGQLIRENFSPRVAALAALPMVGADVTIYILEYAGIAIGLQIFGIPPYVSVPSTFALNILFVYRRRYAQIEKPLLAISFVLAVSYGISAYYSAGAGIRFDSFYLSASPTFLFLIAANVGSTIVPFMLFYQASASAEKGITSGNLWAMRLETAVGAVISEVILIAVEVAAVGVHGSPGTLASPQALSGVLSAVSGGLSPYLFGVGLISAGFVALIVVSLGSAWAVTSAMGWGKNNLFRVYLLESIPALAISLLPFNLVGLSLSLLAFQVIVLVTPAILLGLIASKRSLMGTYSLKRSGKFLYWSLLIVVVGTGVVSLLSQLV